MPDHGRERRALADELLAGTARVITTEPGGGTRSHPLVEGVDEQVDRLRAVGVGDGDLVLAAGVESEHLLCLAVACWRIRAAVWCTPRPADEVPRGTARFRIDSAFVVTEDDGADMPECPAAVVHETSGSTGRPRLAMRSAASLRAEAVGYRLGLALTSDDTVRVPVPVTHSFGWGVAMSALLSGCVVDARKVTLPGRVAAEADAGHSTVLALTPAVARLVVDSPRRGRCRPRAVLIGAGETSQQLDADVRARFGTSPTRGYGSSETGGILIGDSGLGAPIPSVRVLAPKFGARGVLTVATDAGILGYLGETSSASTRWAMGDVVDRDREGRLRFVERTTGALRVNGKFVDTDTLRAAMRKKIPCAEIVFVAVPQHRQEIEDFVAVVVGSTAPVADILQAAREAGGDRLGLRVRILDTVPRTPLGKLDRPALTKVLAEQAERK